MVEKKICLFEVRIRLQSYNKAVLDNFKKELKLFARNYQLKYSSINLPLKKKRFSVLKSPHVNKKAKDQYEIVFLNRLIVLKGCFPNSILYDKLQQIEAEGISMKVVVLTH